MPATRSRDGGDHRPASADRLAPRPARMLTFRPRLTDADRWQRLCAVDPRSAAMIETAFRTLYAYHFPDD